MIGISPKPYSPKLKSLNPTLFTASSQFRSLNYSSNHEGSKSKAPKLETRLAQNR